MATRFYELREFYDTHTRVTVTCDYPPQQHPVVLVSGSQDSHPLIEGQYITYTCPSGFVLTGPNASVCTENGEWEPDPGEVDCIGNNYYAQHCHSDAIHNNICHSNGSWIPDPTQFILVHHYQVLST